MGLLSVRYQRPTPPAKTVGRTYTKAFELAQAMEAADWNAKDLQEKAAGIHAVRKFDKAEGPRRDTSNSTCY